MKTPVADFRCLGKYQMREYCRIQIHAYTFMLDTSFLGAFSVVELSAYIHFVRDL